MQLTKHHALANDFLVLLDGPSVDAARARALCDRHRGIGADGLIRCTDLRMELYNADGSRAEVSGNGLACLAQALINAGVVTGPEAVIDTDAGPRRVRLEGRRATVDMGALRELKDAFAVRVGLQPQKCMAVDAGNPHVVWLLANEAELNFHADDAAGFTLPNFNEEFVIAGPEPDAITMRVVERGVGETEACGSGAAAAAWAVRQWGLVGERVTVHQPGGDAVVELAGTTVHLAGPSTFVADVEIAWR